jgi:flap endonuclease-1
MGVNISDIVVPEKCTLEDFKDKIVAIDAYNAIYQFLSSIRTPDGSPLQDTKGRPTSHLTGLLSRTSRLVTVGIKPVFVFDGKPPELKEKTLKKRADRKSKAYKEWQAALEVGDMETAKIKAQQTSKLTKDMVEESKLLLDYLGIPHIQAVSEGESQASYMVQKGEVWAAASQDFDSLLFGSLKLVRNLTFSGRRKLPRQQRYVTIDPEVIKLEVTLQNLSITREQLVDIGILIGTDFNDGIKGIGPKKALKLVQDFGDLETIIQEKGLELPFHKEIRKIFLEPEITDDYEIKWRSVQESKVIELLVEEHDFSQDRVISNLDKIKQFQASASQQSLDQWF